MRQGEVTNCNLDSSAVETSDLSYELQDTFMSDRCATQGCKMSHTLRSVGWWHLEAYSVGTFCDLALSHRGWSVGELMLQTSVYERDSTLLSGSDKELWLATKVGVVWAKPVEDKCVFLRTSLPSFPARLGPACQGSEVISKTSEGFIPVSQCGQASNSPPAPSQG